MVCRKQITWSAFSLFWFVSGFSGNCVSMASQSQQTAFFRFAANPSDCLLFCFFTAASKNEVPLTGTQEPGATFVTAQTGTVLLAGL